MIYALAPPGRHPVRLALRLPARALRLAPALLLLPLLVLGRARAEEKEAPRWRVPIDGAALYRRVEESAWVEGKSRRGFSEPLNPAVVWGGEVEKDGLSLRGPVYDLRDLAVFLASDVHVLEQGGRLELVLDGLREFDRTRVLVQYALPRPDGSQDFVALFLPEPEGDAPHHRPRRSQGRTLHGRLRATRRFDEAEGHLTSLTSELLLDTSEGEAEEIRTGRIRYTESWTFREVLRASDPSFRQSVDRAIETSARWLRDLLQDQRLARGRFGAPPDGRRLDQWQGSGELALVLLAVLKSELYRDDLVVARALDELRGREILTTYSLACALMAIDAYYTPPRERDRLMADDKAGPAERNPTPADRAVVDRWTRALLEAHDTRIDPGYLLRWRYARSADYDNSNTQYALLGLYAAHLLGAAIPPTAWSSSARHWLADVQDPGEDPIVLSTPTHAELEAREKEAALLRHGGYGTDGSTRDRGPRVAPLAWGYVERADLSGSMTAAAVASLEIAESGTGRRRGFPGTFGVDVDRARRGGLAWLATHFTVRANPGGPHSLCSRGYYLFGVERALEIRRIARLQGRDWYFEGAVWLLETQEDDGSWRGGYDDTAFGLLFLKKAVPPTITPSR